MSDPSNWACNANEALELGLVSVNEDAVLVDTFPPEMTYPIFGDEQLIYGYKKLRIKLHFASGSLAIYLNVDYKAQLETATIKADNVEEKLYDFIPSTYEKNLDAFRNIVRKNSTEFIPPGTLIKSIKRNDEDFEFYRAKFSDVGFRDYHRRMQIFLLFYIEGATYIDEEDDRWEVILMFKKATSTSTVDKTTYHFVGYVTMYPFYAYPDKKRMRISQYIILPPYQGKGLGSELYNTVYADILSRDEIIELTVEDPNEQFDELRDRNDLSFLLSQNVFREVKVPLSVEWIRSTRQKYKIAPRQFARLLDMGLLAHLNKKDAKAYRGYRLHVKKRLFKINEEALNEIPDKVERIEKLDAAYRSNEEYYERVLDKVRK